MAKIRSVVALLLIAMSMSCSSCSKKEEPKRPFRIARESSWYSLRLHGKERILRAFIDDIVDIIAEREGIPIEKVTITPESSLKRLKEHSFDAVFTFLSPKDVRAQPHVFSDMIFYLGPVLIVRIDSPISSLQDMKEKVLGLRMGESLAFSEEKHPSAVIRYYPELPVALEDLEDEQIDAVVVDAFEARKYLQYAYRDKLKLLPTPLSSYGLRLLIHKDAADDSFAKRFNELLDVVKDDGTFEVMLKKWDLIE